MNGEAGDFAGGVAAELELRAGNNREGVADRWRQGTFHSIAVNHKQPALLDAHLVGRIQLLAVITSRKFVQLPRARFEGFDPLKRLRLAIVSRQTQFSFGARRFEFDPGAIRPGDESSLA